MGFGENGVAAVEIRLAKKVAFPRDIVYNLRESVSYLDVFPVGETLGLNVPVARGPVPRVGQRQAVAF